MRSSRPPIPIWKSAIASPSSSLRRPQRRSRCCGRDVKPHARASRSRKGDKKEKMVHKIFCVFSLAFTLIFHTQSTCAAMTAFEIAETACDAYVAEYEASISYGDVYVQRVNTAMRLAWIAGFFSAIRIHMPKDTDIFSRIDPEHIKLWILDYCAKHPTSKFIEAANALYEELKQRK